MRIGAAVKRTTQLFCLLPGHKLAKADIKVPTHSVDAFPPFMYLEPTVAQAPRFARHLIDKRRHPLDLGARKIQLL
jgi:hypothetical protein